MVLVINYITIFVGCVERFLRFQMLPGLQCVSSLGGSLGVSHVRCCGMTGWTGWTGWTGCTTGMVSEEVIPSFLGR